MAVQRDGTVSDIGSGTTDAASVTIIREEKARSKPPHTPIVYHENGTAKRKHGRYVQNRVITPSARAFNSDTDLGHDASRHHQTPSTMYDSDTANARHGRHRSRSNKVYHSDNEMAEDARDSDGDRKSRVHRYPDPDQNDMKKPSRDARGKERQTEKSYTSDTDDTARYEHSMSILDRLYRAQEKDRHNSPSLNSRNVPRQEDDKTGVREHGSEEEETYGKYKDPRPKSGKQERKMMSTTDDSESEIRKVCICRGFVSRVGDPYWHSSLQTCHLITGCQHYVRGHGGTLVTHSPPTSEVSSSNPKPYVGKMIVSHRWSAVYSTEP